ncbi:small acidic protein 1-like [Cornus florida]|nr:small acidic protein 1-like [Cornus florida]XP_059632275.1 small acidic protein 1-like [Cornus florida]
MDVDDVDTLEIFGEGPTAVDHKLSDADFFNFFEDDLDNNSDVN